MLQRARALVADAGRRRRRASAARSTRSAHRFVRRHAAALGLPRRLRRARRRRRRRPDRPRARGARPRAARSAASRARARCSTSTRARSTRSGRCRSVVAEQLPVVRGARARRSPALFKAYTARKRALGVLDLDDLLLYWRALAARRGDRPAHRGGVRPRAGRRVPGRQRPPGRHRARAARDAAARSPRSATTSRRSTASAPRRPSTSSTSPTTSPARDGRHARAQLPLDPADPRRRQRARRAGRARVSASSCAPSASGGAPPAARLLPRRGRAGGRGLRPRAGRRASEGMELREQAVLMRTVARHRPARARARAPADPVRQVRRPALPRGRARQGLPRAAAPGRQPGRRAVAGSACCSCSRASARRRARRALDVLVAGARRRPRCGLAARASSLPAARARRRRRAGRGARDAGAASRAPARAPSGCATRSLRWSRARYPDGALRLQDLDQLVAAAARGARDLRHFVAELVLDPPQSSADLARPAAPRRGLARALHRPLRQGPRVGGGARARASTTATSRPDMAAGTREEHRRGAPAALRRDDPRAARAARLRAAALLPPPARQRRRARLRQAVALPHPRGPGLLRGHAAARRPAEPRTARRSRTGAGSCVSPDALFD